MFSEDFLKKKRIDKYDLKLWKNSFKYSNKETELKLIILFCEYNSCLANI